MLFPRNRSSLIHSQSPRSIQQHSRIVFYFWDPVITHYTFLKTLIITITAMSTVSNAAAWLTIAKGYPFEVKEAPLETQRK
ncbi:hypothetical protein BDV29DRAFT_169453 [Aspergillus leporis]|uniref:Uncharacterized protein n=1 Tax=Aspergillus leporis TaxID=41062 RepID=A0A5N5XBP5_9EURO|nr:hypothetical protein BDV29DRAFT_169453 [Aspergillus leporis]